MSAFRLTFSWYSELCRHDCLKLDAFSALYKLQSGAFAAHAHQQKTKIESHCGEWQCCVKHCSSQPVLFPTVSAAPIARRNCNVNRDSMADVALHKLP